MCSSRKNPYPPHGRSSEIPRGSGVLKVKILEAKYEAKLEFPRGTGGVQSKKLLWGEYGYFLELHNLASVTSVEGTSLLGCTSIFCRCPSGNYLYARQF